jgi:hypothetical protein
LLHLQQRWRLPRWQARLRSRLRLRLGRLLLQLWTLRLSQRRPWRLLALLLVWLRCLPVQLALQDCSWQRLHFQAQSWPLLLLRLLLSRRWLHWRLPWRGLPLWRRLRFRWLWLHQLRLFQLHLQRQQHCWQWPRLQAQSHQPLWLQLAQLLRQRLPLQLWLRHQRQQPMLRPA